MALYDQLLASTDIDSVLDSPVQPIKLLVDPDGVAVLQASSEDSNMPHFSWIVNEGQRERACTFGKGVDQLSIVACQPNDKVHDKVLSNNPSILPLYGSSFVQFFKCLSEGRPTEHPMPSLSIKLQIEDPSADWRSWATALDAWMDQVAIRDWPFWKDAVLTSLVLGESLGSSSQPKESLGDGLILSADLQQAFQSDRLAIDELQIVVYVPMAKELLFSDQKATFKTVLLDENRLVTMVSEELAADAINVAMGRSLHLLQKHGMICGDETIVPATLQSKVWLRLTFLRLHKSAADALNMIHKEVDHKRMQSSAMYDVRDALSLADAAFSDFARDEVQSAVSLLGLCKQQLVDLRKNAQFMPPRKIALDHLLAIFAPLLLPLLLPLGTRVVHEYKRYKKLAAT